MAGHGAGARRVGSMLASGKVVVGTISPFASPGLVKLAAAGGFDLFVVDGEHGNTEPGDIEALVAVSELCGMDLVVRAPGLDRSYIGRCLDAGVDGIVIPHGSTEMARAAVAACRFVPEGERGLGPAFCNNYAVGVDMDEFVRVVNERTLVIVQIEDAESLSALDAIATVPGVDGLLVGPRDLAASLKSSGGEGQQTVDEAIGASIAAARKAGKWAALPAESPAAARAAAARGAQVVLAYLPQLIVAASRDFAAGLAT